MRLLSYCLPDGPIAMIRTVTPVSAYGVGDLSRRWDVSKTVAADWMKSDGFPEVTAVNATETSPGVLIADRDEVHAWEKSRTDAGLPLPGQRARGQRGPDRKPRKLRGSSAGEAADA